MKRFTLDGRNTICFFFHICVKCEIVALGNMWWKPTVALDSSAPKCCRNPLSYQGAFRHAFDLLGYRGPISINAYSATRGSVHSHIRRRLQATGVFLFNAEVFGIHGTQAADRRLKADLQAWSGSCHSDTVFVVISNDDDFVEELEKVSLLTEVTIISLLT